MKRRLAVLLGAVALVLAAAGVSSGAKKPAAQTLLTTGKPILAFAQAGGQATWVTAQHLSGGRTSCELHVRTIRTGRTATAPMTGSGCPGTLDRLAVANGEAAWSTAFSCGNNECFWDVVATRPGWRKPRVVDNPDFGCDADACGGAVPWPRPLLAASGGLLTFWGQIGSTFAGVERLVDGEAKPFAANDKPLLGLAAGGGGLVQTDYQTVIGDGCGCVGLPVWSPDGSKIAYLHGSFDRYGGLAEGSLAVMSSDGSGGHEISSIDAAGGSLSWSPDGSEIAFDALDFGPKIAVAEADGSGTKALTAGSDPAWSPGGSEIAFVRSDYKTDTSAILVMRPDGTHIHKLVGFDAQSGDNAPPPVGGLAWSPDGTRLAFVLAGSLELVNADGSDLQMVGSGIAGVAPSWSPDGSEIVFQGGTGLEIVNADGSGERQLTTGPDQTPSWSPDGKTIVFASDRDDPYANAGIYNDTGFIEIYAVKPDGSDLHPLSFTVPSRLVDVFANYAPSGAPLASTLPGLPALAGDIAALAAPATASGRDKITLFNAQTGAEIAHTAVGPTATDFAVVGGDAHWVVFLQHGNISALNVHSLKVVRLARTTAKPLGLSVAGTRVAWAENSGGHARIRAVQLPS